MSAIRATRSWTGAAEAVVAPLGGDWDDAKRECERRIRATARALEFTLTGNILGQALDTLVRYFPGDQAEIESWSARQIFEEYLTL